MLPETAVKPPQLLRPEGLLYGEISLFAISSLALHEITSLKRLLLTWHLRIMSVVMADDLYG